MDNFLAKNEKKMEEIGKRDENNIEEQTVAKKIRKRKHNDPK